MERMLATHPGPIAILSGEGSRGTWERYNGARTARAIRARLTRERAGGDRWARAYVYVGRDADGAPICRQLDGDDVRCWPDDMPEQDGPGRPPGPHGRGRAIRIYAPATVIDQLDVEAERRGLSRSSAIVEAVLAWLG